jgi:hypothetical protein
MKGTNVFARIINKLFGKKSVEKPIKVSKPEPHEPLDGKGHYYDGNGANGYFHHSSQRKRRKMERRRG